MRLHHVGLCVSDMSKSIAFYRDALGLKLFQDETLSGPDVDMGMLEPNARLRMVSLLDEAGGMIELMEWKSPPARPRPSEHKNFTSIGICELALFVESLDAAEERLATAGYAFRSPAWDFGKDSNSFGGAFTRIRYVEDPDGIQVELMEWVASM